MIVVGYAGGDRSIMESIDCLLRTDRSFPHGVYWCVRPGADLNPMVEDLCRFPNFHVVEIAGFDAFMVEIHQGIGLETHPIIEDPFKVTTKRLESMLDGLKVGGDIPQQLNSDLSALIKKLETPEKPTISIPYPILARGQQNAGNIKECLGFLISGIAAEKDEFQLQRLLEEYVECSKEADVTESDANLIEVVDSLKTRRADLNAVGLQCIIQKRFALARKLIEKDPTIRRMNPDYFAINMAQIEVHQENQLSGEQQEAMEHIIERSGDPAAVYGANCVLQRKAAAIQVLIENFARPGFYGRPNSAVLQWPVSYLLGSVRDELLKSDPHPSKAELVKVLAEVNLKNSGPAEEVSDDDE